MKLKVQFFLLMFACTLMSTFAQWSRVGRFNNVVNDMAVIYNQLYLAGNFTAYDSNDCYFTAHYNESVMTRTTDHLTGTGIRRLLVFQNSLYGTNGLTLSGNNGLATYQMDTWNAETGINTPQTGLYSNSLFIYVGGDDGQLSRKGVSGGGYFSASDSIIGTITAITEYNGAIIVAGSFTTVKGKTSNHIIKINGNSYTNLSSGLDGNVSRLLVYNGNLYAGGTFLNAGGNPAKFLAKWNDTAWSQVGGGLVSAGTNGVKDMIIYNNALYIVGEFSNAGNSNAKNIAKWNDTSWTSFAYNQPGYVSAIETYNNKFYITSFNADSAILYSATISTGLNQVAKEAVLANIYPNPATNELHISLETNFENGMVYDLISLEGKLVLSANLEGMETSIKLNGLEPGIYFVRIKGNTYTSTVQKIVIL